MDATYKFKSAKEPLTDDVSPWEFRSNAKLVAGFSVTIEASNFLTTMAVVNPLTIQYEYPDMAKVCCSEHTTGFVIERQWSNRKEIPELRRVNNNTTPSVDLGFDCQADSTINADSLESLIILSMAHGYHSPVFGLFLQGVDCFHTVSNLTLSFHNYLRDLLKSNDIPLINSESGRQQLLPCLDMIPNRILPL
jgi:hypothetical protein